MMSKQSKTLPPKPVLHKDQVVDESNSRKLGLASKINRSVTLEGFLKDNPIIYKNFLIKEMRQMFPNDPAVWHVEKMVELKNGKQLLIDEPVKEWEIADCKRKSQSLSDLGFIYVCIMPETTLAETLSQMGLEIH